MINKIILNLDPVANLFPTNILAPRLIGQILRLPPIAMAVDGMRCLHKWIYMPHFSSCERAGTRYQCAAWGKVSFMPRLCEGFRSCRRHDLGEQASLLLLQLQRSCCCSSVLLKKFGMEAGLP